jgi:hypothetical protein
MFVKNKFLANMTVHSGPGETRQIPLSAPAKRAITLVDVHGEQR